MKQGIHGSMRFVLLVLVPLALAAPAVPTRSGPHQAAALSFVPGELLVKFRQPLPPGTVSDAPRTGLASVDALLQSHAVTAVEPLFPGTSASPYGLDRIYRLTFPPTEGVLATAGAFAADANVAYAEPNYLFRTAHAARATQPAPLEPNDALFAEQWALHNAGQTGGIPDADIDAPEAWEITTGSDDVLIAVVDTGVDYTHPDLDDGRVRTDIDRDFVNDDADAMDDNGHGTHVTGIIAARANNNIGTSGVMWQAQIVPVKVMNSLGVGSSANISRGIHYAATQGADIINLSLGELSCSQTVVDAVNDAALAQGSILVAAAGNSAGNLVHPARLEPVIAVGAVDHTDQRAAFSNAGAELDIVAPGVHILSTVLDGQYAFFDGTSMATPHVTGVIGLLLAQRPDLSLAQIRALLRASADNLGPGGFDPEYGHGRVNAYQALQTPTPTPPSTPAPGECVACAAGLAMIDSPAHASTLDLLWQVRDDVLAGSAVGREFTGLFYTHSPEISVILLHNPELRAAVQQALIDLTPAFRALTGAGADVIVTTEMVAKAQSLVEALADPGSPALQADLRTTWEAIEPERFVGMPVTEAWAVLEQTDRLYLPLIVP